MFAAEELVSGNDHDLRLASAMPPTVADAVRRAGYLFPGTLRGSFTQPAPDEYETLLHIFTAIPGIPWSEAHVKHRLPPQVPDMLRSNQTGKGDFSEKWPSVPRPLKGVTWREDDLPAMYPLLVRRFVE